MIKWVKEIINRNISDEVDYKIEEFISNLSNMILSDITVEILATLTSQLCEFTNSLDIIYDSKIIELYNLHLRRALDVLKYRGFERFILVHNGREIRFNSYSSLSIYIAKHHITNIDIITDRFIEVTVNIDSKHKILQCFAK